MNAAVFLLAAMVTCVAAAHLPKEDDIDAIWETFKKSHSKHYHCSKQEARRKNIFRCKVRKIRKHNLEYDLGMHTFTMGINKYSDIASEDFSRTMNGLVYNESSTRFAQSSAGNDCEVESLPTCVDWRKKGLVTPVKDQGQCGSCYAFSATGSLEGQMFNKTGKLTSLSEKNIIDCSRKEGNEACNGGSMDNSFRYININKGIDTEESYPYHPFAGKCKYNITNIGGEDIGATDVHQTENCLKHAIANIGPISVGIHATSLFQSYRGGVFVDKHCLKTRPNHGVLAVGYGTTKEGHDYWLVKNSWGPSWGMEGYIKMARNKNDMCGIAYMASYPVV